MDDGAELDEYSGKVSGMAARYAMLGSTLDDSAMVKKLLDTVPDRLYTMVTGIGQFYNVEEMAFEEALRRLKAFEERTRRRVQAGGERVDGQLMMTAAEWAAPERRQGRRVFGVRGEHSVGQRREASWTLLHMRGARALPARVPAAAERTGGGACSLGRRQYRRRRTPLGRGLGSVCWNKPQRVWSGLSDASDACGTGGTH